MRSVTTAGAASIEGPPRRRTVHAADQFPPAAPKGLAAVPTAGQISLIWDANLEKDLAGYLVLRVMPGRSAPAAHGVAHQGSLVP